MCDFLKQTCPFEEVRVFKSLVMGKWWIFVFSQRTCTSWEVHEIISCTLLKAGDLAKSLGTGEMYCFHLIVRKESHVWYGMSYVDQEVHFDSHKNICKDIDTVVGGNMFSKRDSYEKVIPNTCRSSMTPTWLKHSHYEHIQSLEHFFIPGNFFLHSWDILTNRIDSQLICKSYVRKLIHACINHTYFSCLCVFKLSKRFSWAQNI